MSNSFDKPVYMELDGQFASMIPQKDGGILVSKSCGISIADFMQDGSVITKKEYEALEKIFDEKYKASQK